MQEKTLAEVISDLNGSSNRSNKGLTLETSPFKLIMVANLRYQLS